MLHQMALFSRELGGFVFMNYELDTTCFFVFQRVLKLQNVVLCFREHYFTVVAWADDNTVLVTWLNRAQNLSYVTLCQISDGLCQIVSGHAGLKNIEGNPPFAYGQAFTDKHI